MRRLIYQVAVGAQRPLWERCMATVQAHADAHGIDYEMQQDPALRIRPSANNGRSAEAVERLGYLPIYEKENALAALGEYERVAIIDADVWIRPGAPCIFDALPAGYDCAMMPERSAPITERYARKLDSYERGQYAPLGGVGMPFRNMGVMLLNKSLRRLCPEEPSEFLARPEFQRFIDGLGAWKWSTDQTLLNWWLASSGAIVADLDWRWNAMYGAIDDARLAEAHAVHFFLSGDLSSDDPEALLAGKGSRVRV